ncbi:MAG TPA: FGGY-family carbohydrate kinase [Vicinamibacterales bacterium]|nr:FGGY-family carbohydrate kinase [Vicinamibacterales bacterium]HWI20711.1 FGGY-family carbohydrate kinase [Vicinamibacterales bacterium]
MTTICVGVDLGTSVVKATALDVNSGERHQIASAYGSRSAQASPSGWSSVLERILTTLFDQIESGVRVEALSITSMVPNVALRTESDEPIGTLLFCDDDAYELELSLDKQLNSPKWANEVLSKVLLLSKGSTTPFRWYSTHNWLVRDLTGAFVVDTVTAGECGSLIEPGHGWNGAILGDFGIDRSSLPEIMPPATFAGRVRASYGVPQLRGVPVTVGSSDTVATALGAGLANERDALLVYYGTFNSAARITRTRDEVLFGLSPLNPFQWILSVPRAGEQLSHLAGLITDGENRTEQLALFDALAASSEPGARGIVFLHSDDLRQTTVSSRPRGSVRYLEPHHTRGDLARALLEGFAYLLRWAIETESTTFSAALAAGGGARSNLWRQIVSDVTGLTQVYRPSADRGVGSALLAAAAIDKGLLDKLTSLIAVEDQACAPGDSSRYAAPYARYLETWI